MNKKTSLKALAVRFERMKVEQEAAANLIPLAFPIGSEVCYAHGERLRWAKVIEHPSHNHLRVKVRGATGAEYWIDVWHLLYEMVEGFGR